MFEQIENETEYLEETNEDLDVRNITPTNLDKSMADKIKKSENSRLQSQ